MRFLHIFTNRTTHAEASEESTTGTQRIRRLRSLGSTTAEAVGFWVAVVLPIPTVLLLGFGVGTLAELGTVASLLAVNLLAFYIGHDYSRSDTADRH